MAALLWEDYLDALLDGPRTDYLRVGLVLPTSGVMGLTGPAGMLSALLAMEELNERGLPRHGGGRLVPVDAGRAPREVAQDVRALVQAGVIDAVVGFHTSDVHRAIESETTGRVPYLFTPPHEGGQRGRGVALLDSDPAQQLAALSPLLARRSLRRWALIGTDYIWPRAVHRTARRVILDGEGEVVLERLVPFRSVEPEQLVEDCRRHRVQGVLVSLIGRDLATFNRAFFNSPFAQSVVRVSGALEETGLLEVEGDDTGELYSMMSWYAQPGEDDAFQARYSTRFGIQAPQLGAYARGCHRGVHLVGMAAAQGLLEVGVFERYVRATNIGFASRLARAEGLALRPYETRA